MELLSNLGRRNIVMSQPMEEFFAHELAKELDGHVECDGRTGKADIVIHSLGKELECKLNTPHGKRSHSLQADWVTVGKKGCLDFPLSHRRYRVSEVCCPALFWTGSG